MQCDVFSSTYYNNPTPSSSPLKASAVTTQYNPVEQKRKKLDLVPDTLSTSGMGRVWLVLVMVMVTRIVSVNKANCSFRV
jgi:hypothetical protein